MHDFDLFDDGRRIGGDEQSTQVIDQEFITTFIAIQCDEGGQPPSSNEPFGPKLVRTRSDSSETAWMLRRTASSSPCRY